MSRSHARISAIELHAAIADEVAAQLAGLRAEVAAQLAGLRAEVAAQLGSRPATGGADDELREWVKDIATDAATSANERQLVVARQQNMDLISAIGQEVCDTVYDQVVQDINEKVVPKVAAMVQWVNYSLADPGEIVTDYRLAVAEQVREDEASDQKLITDGRPDPRIIAPHVRVFFGEDD